MAASIQQPVAGMGVRSPAGSTKSKLMGGGRGIKSSFFSGTTPFLVIKNQSRLSMRVASRNAYICRDCGYIYNDRKPFEKLPDKYFCPVCGAPKKRFRPYEQAVARNANDTKVRKARKEEMKGPQIGGVLPIAVVVGVVVLLGAYLYLNGSPS